ncbi:MAG: transposase [Pseudomonadota bacterium]
MIPLFAFRPGIRRVIDTSNAAESLNRVIRNAIKTRGSVPSEKAAEKLIYLATRGHENASGTVSGGLTAVNPVARFASLEPMAFRSALFEDRFKPIPG